MRFCALTLTTFAYAALSACSSSDAVAPPRDQPSATASLDLGSQIPGYLGAPHIVETQGGLHGCTPRDVQVGTATIGPSGGVLEGPHRLIIPPGALTQTVQISGTTVEGETPTIELEPHGLQFRKSAGLVLDVSNWHRRPRRRLHQ